MSDQVELGQESEIEEGQPTVEEVSPSQYLTKQEAEKYFKNIEDSVIARQVGIYGKGQTKLLEKLEALETNIKQLREAGVDITPAAEMKLRDNAYKEALTSGHDSKPQRVDDTAAQQSQTQGLSPDVVNDMGNRMLKSMGVDFKDGDPEIKKINMNGTPEQYLSTLAIAAAAWKERTSTKPDPETRIPGIVGGGVSNREAEINDQLSKLLRNPQRNMNEINKLTKELEILVRK